MKALLRKKNGSQPHQAFNGTSSPLRQYLFDRETGLYVEDYFLEALSTERKRAERSGKPFLLMTLDIQKAFGKADFDESAKRLALTLFSHTRETDMKGWFKNNAIAGIIFTETNGTDRESFMKKISAGLDRAFTPKQVEKMLISLYVFPDHRGQKHKAHAEKALYPDLSRKSISRRITECAKRTLDIVGSGTALIVLSPVFLGIALCIKCTSRGPVFFKQKRVGRFGREFVFLKFRSMHVNNDHALHQEYVRKFICEQKAHDSGNGPEKCTYKIKDDPRVTPIGRFIRKTSLDELPQFINVLLGSMSLVGPRPPIPYELENYNIWHKRRVLEVKPGITGLWQVMGRSSTTFDEMVRLDLQYIRNRSLLLDIVILLKTPRAVISCRGAY